MASIPTAERPGAADLELWRALAGACAEVTAELERALEPYDLTASAYEVLAHLAAAPRGRARMHDLAVAVHLSRSGLTRLVDRLERAELVSRARCSDDLRGAFACLTSGGRAIERRAAPRYRRVLGGHLARLTADERRALQRVLARLGSG